MSVVPLQPERLTAPEVPAFLARIARAPAGQAIDLSLLQAFDSAGLAALVNVAARAPLRQPPEKLRKLAALYGIDRIFSEPS